jgi:hypothetical protein
MYKSCAGAHARERIQRSGKLTPLPPPPSARLQLGSLLRGNSFLLRLDLDYNRLGPKTLSALAAGLRTNRTLRSVSLEQNALTGDDGSDVSGVAALAAALSVNDTLESLNLFQIGLGAEGGRLLAEGMAANTSVVALQLSPVDGARPADLGSITESLRRNVAEAEARRSAAKVARAEERRAAAERQRADDAAAAAAAEEAGVAGQAASRAAARDAAEKTALREAAAALARRAAEEKERREAWQADKAAAEKKKAKKGGDKKGKKAK